MAEFFEQICEILAENAEKHPGYLVPDENVKEFFQAVSKSTPEPQTQKTHVSPPPTPVRSAPLNSAAPQTQTHSKTTPPAIRADSLDDLRESLNNCQLCPLCAQRNHIVFGEGNPQARLMFIGEGPGYDEDISGRPFVGKAGQLLDKMIKAMRLSREEVYIANIVKCRPPGNRNPMPEEMEKCIPFLVKQIEIIRPQVIICLGATATKALLNTQNGISRLRGRWCNYNNIPVMPTFHPAFLLRQESAKRDAWHDLQQVMSFLAGHCG